MIFEKKIIDGTCLIKPEINEDYRGSFFRTYCKDEFKKAGISFAPIQTSQSHNIEKGTIRGLHYQKSPYEEDKLVSCIKGKIFDVIVDLRIHSKTFKKWLSFELSEKNHYALFIPKGCAHGFQTLTNNTVVQYNISVKYVPKASKGIRYNDPILHIVWPINIGIISDKDKKLPFINSKIK